MISIDSSVLSSYYLAKEGISASSTGTSGTSTTGGTSTAGAATPLPPWDVATPKTQKVSAASALATQVLNGQNIIDPSTKLTNVSGASAEYKDLFTLYQGLSALEGMTEQMLATGASAADNAKAATAFQNGLSQVQTYVNGLDLPTNARITTGAVSSSNTSSVGPATEDDTYNTPVIFVGALNTAVPAFQGTVQFNINVTGLNKKQTSVPIDLSGMGTTARTMPNVTNYINSQLQAAGVSTRFSDNETPGQPETIQVSGQSVTLPAGPDQWGWTINGVSTEQVSFSAPATAGAVYVAQTSGNVAGYANQVASDASTAALDAEEGIKPPTTTSTSSTSSSSSSSTSTSSTSSSASSTDTISQPFQQLLTFQTNTSTTSTAPAAATSLPGTTNAVAGEISATALDSSLTSVQATATGADGSLYVLGNVNGTTDNQTIQGTQDVVLQKYDSTGNLVYTQTLGAESSASGYSLAVAADGSVAVAGSFNGSLDPGDTGNGPTGTDSFVTLYNASGDEQWTQTGLQPSNNQVNSVAFGANDSVLVAGQTNVSTPASTAYGPSQGFISGYSSTGTQLFSTATTGVSNASDIAVDGNTVVVAGTSSTGDAVVSNYTLQTKGAPVLNTTRDLGALGTGSIAGVAINNGQVILAGTTTNGSLNAGTVTSAAAGGQDAFVAQLSENLTPAAGDQIAYFGGAKGTKTTATALTISGGQVYIAGSSNTAFSGLNKVGTQDGYVASVDIGSGTIGWSERFSGQDGYAAPESIAVNNTGASILNKLGLPTQIIQQTSSQLLTTATSLRAGDSFQVRTHEGGTPATVTIAADDTIQTLESKIVAATGYTAKVSTETLDGETQVVIKPNNPSSTIELLPGPSGSNALTALGLSAGIVQTAPALANGKKQTTTAIALNTYGLNIDGGFNLTTTAGIQAAQTQLQKSAAIVQTAFYNLVNGNKPAATTPQAKGTVPAYLQSQLANYQAGLSRLESSSSSSSSGSSSTSSGALSSGTLALSILS